MFTENAVDSTRILYTPSSFARSSLIFLQETGKLKALKPHTSQRKGLNSLLFFVVLSGTGSLSYRNETIALIPGDCVFIDCILPYAHSTFDTLWQLQWVHFSGSNTAGIYQKYLERGGQAVFHPNQIEPYTELLDKLYFLANSDDYLKDMRINENLAKLLTIIMEMSWQPEKQHLIRIEGENRFRITAVKAYLDDHWSEKIALKDLSERFYINQYYLARLFKQQYGTSILSYLSNLRITRAKNLLRFTKDSVEMIGRQCGYEDANYFSRIFKKTEGVSPMKYRESW